VSPVLPAVSFMVSSSAKRDCLTRRLTSPVVIRRTLLSCSSSSSSRELSRNNCMRARISDQGRRQLSVPNVKRVRMSIWSSPQTRTMSRTVSRAERWPSERRKSRLCAQRPLPSMMMAMCLGNLPDVLSSDWRSVSVIRARKTREKKDENALLCAVRNCNSVIYWCVQSKSRELLASERWPMWWWWAMKQSVWFNRPMKVYLYG